MKQREGDMLAVVMSAIKGKFYVGFEAITRA